MFRHLMMALLAIGLFCVPTLPAFAQDDAPVIEESVPEDTEETAAAPSPEEVAPPVSEPAEVESDAGFVPENPPAIEEVPEGEPQDEAELASLLGALPDAIQSKAWPVVAGTILLFIVYVLRRAGLDERLDSKYLPWLAVGIAVLSTLGMALVSGIAVFEAVMQGLLSGVTAIGGWELLFKHILSSTKAAEPAAE